MGVVFSHFYYNPTPKIHLCLHWIYDYNCFTRSLCLIWVIYQFSRNRNYFYLYCICITLFIHIFSLYKVSSTNLTSSIFVKLKKGLKEIFNILFISNAMHNSFFLARFGAKGLIGIMCVHCCFSKQSKMINFKLLFLNVRYVENNKKGV